MPTLTCLSGYHLSYRANPHIEFNPDAEVSEAFGDWLIANELNPNGTPRYAWKSSEPTPETKRRRSPKADGAE